MIDIIKAGTRHFSDFGWLKTYWLFSFDDYYDPSNLEFGALRVFNDDVVAPSSGFPTHSHREMEIVTLVLAGELTHADSTGSRGVIRAGDVQRMSAGTGISHSEHNLGSSPLHFHQIWIRPDVRGLAPEYEQKSVAEIPANQLTPVASGEKLAGAVTVHSDSTIYLGKLAAGKTIEYAPGASRGVFVYVTAGSVAINDKVVETNDQARIRSEEKLMLEALEAASFVLIDVSHRH
jgi:redox-sensitive bicupin YhaK (pirin superfamily)